MVAPCAVHAEGDLDDEIAMEEPAFYEAELRTREQQFGPNHPQVRPYNPIMSVTTAH
jgi:hypothetical protein